MSFSSFFGFGFSSNYNLHDFYWNEGYHHFWSGRQFGGSGDDDLVGGDRADRLYGRRGDDFLDGGAGNDRLYGGRGDDVLFGMSGHDRLYGGRGDDVMDGGTGHDRLYGGRGDDFLDGGEGSDRLYGGSGDDALFGMSGSDRMYGGRGDDIMDGGAGSDQLKGGKGDDIAIYSASENVGFRDYYDGGKGHDTLKLNFTSREWLDLNATGTKLQDDLTNFETSNGGSSNGWHGWHGRHHHSKFQFQSLDLKARNFENLEVSIDGELVDAADNQVSTIDDIVSGADGAIEDGATITGSVVTNDTIPDLLREVRLVSDVGAGQGSLILNVDGTFEYSVGQDFQNLAKDETTEVSFTYEAEDADGDKDQATVTITVTGTNDGPIAVADTAKADARRFELDGSDVAAVTGSVADNDSDIDNGAQLSYALVAPIDGLTLGVDGQYSFDPADPAYQSLGEGEIQTVVANYTVTDEHNAQANSALTITVTGTNNAPVAEAITGSSNEDGSAITIAPVFTDANVNDVHTFTVDTTGTLGSVTVKDDGTFEYSANGAFESLGADATTTDTFSYTVDDGRGGTATQSATITITGQNDIAMIGGDSSNTIFEDNGLVAPVDEQKPTASGILTITDVDSGEAALQPIAEGTIGDAGYGTFEVAANGAWTFTLDNASAATQALGVNEEAIDTITVSSLDGSANQVLTLFIQGTNDGPIANPTRESVVAETTNFLQSTAVSLVGDVSTNDSDADSDAILTYSLDAPVDGLTFLPDGKFIFEKRDPSYAALAKDDAIFITANYTVSDQFGETAQSDLQIVIVGENDAPVARLFENVVQLTDSSIPLEPVYVGTVDYAGMDVDDRAKLSFALSNPIEGVTMDADTGDYYFDVSDPAYASFGADAVNAEMIDYTVTDEFGAMDSNTITLTIIGTNDNPIAVADTLSAVAGSGLPALVGSVATNDSDLDDFNQLSFQLDTPIAGLTMASNGDYTFDTSKATYAELNQGEVVTLVADYTVSDGDGGTAQSTLTITVTGTNDAPVAKADSAVSVRHPDGTNPGQFMKLERSVATNDRDADADAVLTYTLITQVAGLTMNTDGSYVFDPNHAAYADLAVGEVVNITTSYTVTDEFGAQDTADLNIKANLTNTAPTANAISTYSVPEGESFEGRLVAVDAETPQSELTFEFLGYQTGFSTTGLSNAAIDLREDGTFTYTPDTTGVVDFAATDLNTFLYQVYDEQGLTPFGNENVLTAVVNITPGASGVTDTLIEVSKGSSADVLKVVLTGSLVDSDGSEYSGVDTSNTAGELILISGGDLPQFSNNPIRFEYVFDWKVDDTVDLSQPISIDVLTTEAVRIGQDPDDFSGRRATTEVLGETNIVLESNSQTIGAEFSVADNQSIWSSGDANSTTLSSTFGLDTGAFDFTKGFLGGAFKLDAEGQFKFGFTPTLTLTDGSIDATVEKTIQTNTIYNETFDQFTFEAFSQTVSGSFETKSPNGSLDLDFTSLAKLDADLIADFRVNIPVIGKTGLYEKINLVDFEIGSTESIISDLSSDDIGGRIPIIGVPSSTLAVDVAWPDVQTQAEDTFNFNETKILQSGQVSDNILSIDADLDALAYDFLKQGTDFPSNNPFNPIDFDKGGVKANLAILDVNLDLDLALKQEFDLTHAGSSGYIVFEDGTRFDVDIHELGKAGSGSALTIENASSHDLDGDGIEFDFFVNADATLRNQTDIDFDVELTADVLKAELEIPLLSVDVGVGPLLTLETDTSVNLFGLDRPFDLAFNELQLDYDFVI